MESLTPSTPRDGKSALPDLRFFESTGSRVGIPAVLQVWGSAASQSARSGKE